MSTHLFGLITWADPVAGLALLDAIGFRRVRVHWEDDAETVLAHAELSWGRHGGLMAGSVDRDSDYADSSDVGRGRFYCVVETDGEVDETYQRALTAGARALTPPADEDYGGRFASVADLEGNTFGIGSYAGGRGSAALRPKLVVDDADAAIAFYTEAFGAEVEARYAMGGSVVFAQLHLVGLGLGLEIQLKDRDDCDPPADPPGVILEVTVPDPDTVWDRAVGAGASERIGLADQPYGPRQGRLVDPFGHQWLISGPLTLSPAQTQAALDQM